MTDPHADAVLEAFPAELRKTYTPLAALGTGAAGTVFRAREEALGREVAVKIGFRRLDGETAERFQREASALARVEHPNVLRLYTHGVTGEGQPYLVTELLEGDDLEAAGPLENALEIMLPIADALDAVHAAGLVHRDVKPGNIVVDATDRPVLVDFGIVLDPKGHAITRTGEVVGTLAYMAPERLEGDPGGPPADWYAWGLTLHKLAHGSLPSEDAGGRSLSPEASRLLEVVARTTREDPGKRAFGRRAIEKILARPIRAGETEVRSRLRSKGPVLGGLLSVALIVAGVFWVDPRPPAPPTRAPSPSSGAQEKALRRECRELIRSFLEGIPHQDSPDRERILVERIADPRTPLRLRRIFRQLEENLAALRDLPGEAEGRRAWIHRTIWTLNGCFGVLARARTLSQNPLLVGPEPYDPRRVTDRLPEILRNLEDCERSARDLLRRSRPEVWGGPLLHAHLALAIGGWVRVPDLDDYLRPALSNLPGATAGWEVLQLEIRIARQLARNASASVLGCARRLEILDVLDESAVAWEGRVSPKQWTLRHRERLISRTWLVKRCPEAERLLLGVLASIEHVAGQLGDLSKGYRSNLAWELGNIEKWLAGLSRRTPLQEKVLRAVRGLAGSLAS